MTIISHNHISVVNLGFFLVEYWFVLFEIRQMRRCILIFSVWWPLMGTKKAGIGTIEQWKIGGAHHRLMSLHLLGLFAFLN